ncbi:Cof-type HAD-IIB family hydrolase [Pseudomonas sp.]|uniref:Cof-type HAD-IIB family hydrolase n=1 Tax=Pseudomonas sp. TaxID=306 RepID=UPI002588C21B|nr:Cof-type HAD-IIB family hydrolase [Pseudomonas sp.]
MSERPDDFIRLVLSDMDGTLLLPDHSIGPRVLDAVGQLREAGVAFSLASARPPRAMLDIVRTLGIDVPFAAFNGGTLARPDGSVLERHSVDRRAVDTSLALFARHPVAIWLFADDQWLLTSPDAQFLQKEIDALGYGYVQVEDFTPYLDRVDKIVATCGDFELLARLEHELGGLIEGQALAARSQSYYLDVTALLANKGDALASLAGHLDIPLDQTAVLGDGGNDVAMFKRAGLSVAMGQADDAVKAHADHVTASNREQGVADAIRDLILPRAPHTP